MAIFKNIHNECVMADPSRICGGVGKDVGCHCG